MYTGQYPIQKTYWEALDEGRILAMKCTKCGAIESEPVPTCNTCGCLDMEWMEVKPEAVCKQVCTANGDRYHMYDGECDTLAVCVMEYLEDGAQEFYGGIRGITNANIAKYKAKVPFKVKAEFVKIKGMTRLFWVPVGFEIE